MNLFANIFSTKRTCVEGFVIGKKDIKSIGKGISEALASSVMRNSLPQCMGCVIYM